MHCIQGWCDVQITSSNLSGLEDSHKAQVQTRRREGKTLMVSQAFTHAIVRRPKAEKQMGVANNAFLMLHLLLQASCLTVKEGILAVRLALYGQIRDLNSRSQLHDCGPHRKQLLTGSDQPISIYGQCKGKPKKLLKGESIRVPDWPIES